jgi:phospholipid/cholesterol/gamma-HCH transport system substrate-binding protein
METEKYYFRVGLFALAGMALFVWYLVIFHGGSGQGVIRYATYFDSSVVGLARGAPVRHKGLDMGVVTDIHFVARDDDKILVLMDLSGTAPIRADTVAEIAFQGITGATYLALENTRSGEKLPPLEAKPGADFPVIKSRPSDLQEVFAKLTGISDQIGKLLSDANIAAVQDVILSTQGALGEAAGALREIRMLTRTVREDPSVILRGPEYQGYKPKK